MAQAQPSSPAMTVERAREVLWLRNISRYHRPMGELIDEGYLTEARLQWAAANAYDVELKEAASVLLAVTSQTPPAEDPQEEPVPATTIPDSPPVRAELPPLKLPVSLDQARAAVWPFGQLRGQPMGDLVDSNRIGLRDLAYAVENAWDRRVRDAAVALLSLRLNQVATESEARSGHLRVVSAGKSYSENKELGWTMLQGFFYGVVFLAWLELVISLVRRLIRDPRSVLPRLAPETLPDSVPLALAVALIIGLLILVWWLMGRVLSLSDRMDEQIERAQKGMEGEEALEEALRQNLDGTWALYRNLTLPGRNRADIDGVLVGPAGVWTLEAKNFSGEYRNFGEHWEVKVGKRWRLYKKSPSRQARNNAMRLAEFLRADGIKQFVKPAVVWVNRAQPPIVEHPLVPVWTWDRLTEELGNLGQGAMMGEALNHRINAKLDDLCRRNAERSKERQR